MALKLVSEYNVLFGMEEINSEPLKLQNVLLSFAVIDIFV